MSSTGRSTEKLVHMQLYQMRVSIILRWCAKCQIIEKGPFSTKSHEFIRMYLCDYVQIWKRERYTCILRCI